MDNNQTQAVPSNLMISAIAQQANQPEVTFQALEELVQDTIGVKLFTLMEVDHQRGVAWRNYSNQPQAYPVSGEKPFLQNHWTDIVHKQHQMFVANSIDEIAAVFPDHQLIQSLGCESCLNIPIVIAGQLRGTINCLERAGFYTPEKVLAANRLKQAGALAFLMSAHCR